MRRIVILLFASLLFGACSSRVLYEQPEPTALAAAVNINIASIDELEKLPHIGRKTAESIVAFREENGPFRRAEHLMLIKGVSEKRFAELRPFLRVQ